MSTAFARAHMVGRCRRRHARCPTWRDRPAQSGWPWPWPDREL